MKIYRVQDCEGRGPWKPGFSKLWVEDRADEEYERLKPVFLDFPNIQEILREIAGKHTGVGCESLSKLRQWFTESEYSTLRNYGYQCVSMSIDCIVASSDIQCVFIRSKPLYKNVVPVRLFGESLVRA